MVLNGIDLMQILKDTDQSVFIISNRRSKRKLKISNYQNITFEN
jgi:hypothetical protein